MRRRIFGKEVEMDFFETICDFAAMGVEAWGAAQAIIGIITFSEGHSQQNQGKKDEGFGKIVGGGVIFAVGLLLVPQISSL